MDRVMFNFNETEEPRGESKSREPLPAGVYRARVVDSKFELTKTEIVIDAQDQYVRRIREYVDGSYTEEPITNEERQRGCKVSKSGTSLYLRLHCDVDGLQWPKNVILRLNLENKIADPWSGRKLFQQLGKAIGLTECPLDIDHPVLVIHDKDFLVELTVKPKRGGGGKENEAVAISPLNVQVSDGRPAYLAPGTEIVDVVSSKDNRAAAHTYNDNDIPF